MKLTIFVLVPIHRMHPIHQPHHQHAIITDGELLEGQCSSGISSSNAEGDAIAINGISGSQDINRDGQSADQREQTTSKMMIWMEGKWRVDEQVEGAEDYGDFL